MALTTPDAVDVTAFAFYDPDLPDEYDYAYELYLLFHPVVPERERLIAKRSASLPPERCGECRGLRRHFWLHRRPDGSRRCSLCRDTEQDRESAARAARREADEQALRDALAEPIRNCLSCDRDLPRENFPRLSLQRPLDDHRRCTACVRVAARCAKYGITVTEFWTLLAVQENHCAICADTFDDVDCAYIDHDHVTEQVRGLLCHGCNVGIGWLGDTLDGVEKAAAYLRRALQGSVGGPCDTSDSHFYRNHNPVITPLSFR